MTDHLMPPLRAIARDGDDDPAALRRLVQLDPCSAWRADLEDAGLHEPLPEAQAERWLLWLQIGTVFDRLRLLPVPERAAYAHGTAGLWETAVRVTGAERFGRVGEVMAEWRGEAPELPGFRELLWAVEQVEADGALWSSTRAVANAQRMVRSAVDLRRAYGAAQFGRLLRTAGSLRDAECQYQFAVDAAERAQDRWLAGRSLLGLGVVKQARGNYPAAQEQYERVLITSTDHTDLLVAARIGLVSVLLTLGAFEHAATHASVVVAVSASETESDTVEVLAMLADIGLETGQYSVAMRACTAAIARGAPARKLPFFQRGLLISSAMLREHDVVLRSVADMERMLLGISNRWERSFSRLVLGRVLEQYEMTERGQHHLVMALAEARECGFHEIVWKAEQTLENVLKRMRSVRQTGATAVNQPTASNVLQFDVAQLDRLLELAV